MRKDELSILYRQGLSLYDINKRTGINRTYIAIVLDECGIRKHKTKNEIDEERLKYIEENEKYILEQYSDGKSVGKIGKLLRAQNIPLTDKCIKKILKSNGIQLKTARYYNKKFEVDENTFCEYNKYSCYWAGLLAADGCIYQRKDSDSRYVILAMKDEELVNNFAKYIKYTGGVHKICKRTDFIDESIIWEVRCNSNRLCDDLKKNFNITSGKTLVYEPPKTIPYDLIKYFILGYIDGDGCITYCSTNTGRKQFCLNIVGTYEMISFISNYLGVNHLKLIQRYPERKNNNVTINIQGNTQLYRMLSELYNDGDINKICMQRKYKRFLMIKKQQERKEASA